jgi:integrase
LRGLRWIDIDLKRGEIHVRQRADRHNKMGPPKSEAGERTIPQRKWVENYSNIVKCGLMPIQIAAMVTDKNGAAKYTGLHSLRQFYASWCINRRVDGGLELPLKLVQNRMGHGRHLRAPVSTRRRWR